ncbi:MAG: hypothetical protein HY864_17855 [Chloroflexi bacterium]|nr:hypothetical protein [Chloroflexota bacterium]
MIDMLPAPAIVAAINSDPQPADCPMGIFFREEVCPAPQHTHRGGNRHTV